MWRRRDHIAGAAAVVVCNERGLKRLQGNRSRAIKVAATAIATASEQHRLRESEARTQIDGLELVLRTAAERSKQIGEARRILAKSLESPVPSTSFSQTQA